MKKIIIVSASFVLAFTAKAQVHKTTTHTTHPAQTTTQQQPKFTDFDDSVSYALGISMGEYYQQQGVKNINTILLTRGIKTVMNKDSALFTDEQVGEILNNAMQRYASQKSVAAKHEGEMFLAKNKNTPGVITLADGLQYQVLQKGAGAIPTDTSNVKVNYIGSLLSGKEFDNSYKRGEALDLSVSNVIRGWTEVLKLMPVGSKWRVWIPSDLAYGDRGAGQDIPPGATLQFDIELIGINK